MKLCNRIWAFSSLDCNGFGPSVLFNLLLQDWEKYEAGSVVITDCITATRAGGSTFLVLLRNTLRTMLTTYRRPPGNVGMLLIEVFLKLWELVKVPLFLPQSFSGIAELPTTTSTTVATKARRTTAIAAIKFMVYKVKLSSARSFEATTATVRNGQRHTNSVIL